MAARIHLQISMGVETVRLEKRNKKTIPSYPIPVKSKEFNNESTGKVSNCD